MNTLTNEMIDTRRKFRPDINQIYKNAGGGEYFCTHSNAINEPFAATLINIKSGWVIVAHGIGIYENGLIDWDFSTGGHFDDEMLKAVTAEI